MKIPNTLFIRIFVQLFYSFILIFVFLFAFYFISALIKNNDSPIPFSSDGCSGFPNGTPAQNELWLGCCQAHDLAYWQGGTYRQRRKADEALQACVAESGEPEIALLMLAGVRVGGSPLFPSTFRWGYGWDYPRFYGELNENEQALIQPLLPRTEIITSDQ